MAPGFIQRRFFSIRGAWSQQQEAKEYQTPIQPSAKAKCPWWVPRKSTPRTHCHLEGVDECLTSTHTHAHTHIHTHTCRERWFPLLLLLFRSHPLGWGWQEGQRTIWMKNPDPEPTCPHSGPPALTSQQHPKELRPQPRLISSPHPLQG